MKDQEGRRERLTTLEETYSSVINNPLMAIVIAVKDELKFVNNRALEVSGFSKTEFSRLFNAGLEIIHPDDHPRILQARQKDISKSCEESLIIRIRHKSSGYTWIESYVKEIPYLGETAIMISFIDISKRISYMNKLEESEEKFRKYFNENSSVKILVEDQSRRIKDFNKAALNFYSYKQEEMQDLPVESILNDKNTSFRLFTENILAKKESYLSDIHKTSSGEKREVEVFVTPLVMNKRKYFLFTVEDATEKSHLLRKKEEFNNDLLLLSEAAKNIVSLKKEDEIYDYMINMIHKTHNVILICNIIDNKRKNVTVRSITGISNKLFASAVKLIGESPLSAEYELGQRNIGAIEPRKLRYFDKGFEDFIKGYLPKRIIKPLKKLLKIKNVYLLGLERNGMLYAEFQFFFTEAQEEKPRKHFIETLASLTSSVLHRTSLEYGLSNSETKFRNLVEQSADGIIITDDKGTIIHCNKAMADISGYNQDKILNKDVWDIRNLNFRLSSSAKSHKFTREEFIKGIKSGKGEWFYDKMEREFIHADGSPRVFEITVFPFSSLTGQHLCVIARDITDEKINELKLKEQTKAMEDLIKTRDKFFSIIAHDLKGPIGNNIGFARILKEELRLKNVERSLKITDTIENSSVKILNLLNNLLEWSRLQTGKISCRQETFNLADSITENIDILKETAKIKKIKLKFEKQNAWVYADVNMINTVIRNLLSNAIKFSHPEGEVRVVLDPGINTVQVSVIDNGVGIPENVVDHLFRIENSFSTRGTDNESGTGLGLILCKDFIEKNGGMIDVRSKENSGTEFFFHLPAALEK